MNEWKRPSKNSNRRESPWGKTVIAIVAAAGTSWWAFRAIPPVQPPAVFQDAGGPLFPDLKDPLSAASMEVVTFNEATGTAAPFKVAKKDGRWVIPSHFDYPADAKDRMAKSAALLVDVTKGGVRSDRALDHEALGVVDPLDESTAAMKGRGRRVTLKGARQELLADVIIGASAEKKSGMVYARLPGQKRTYEISLDPQELSSRFEDWIEKDILEIAESDIKKVLINHYRVDEESGEIKSTGVVVLSKPARDGTWMLEGLAEGEETRVEEASRLAKALDDLQILNVRPKPAGLAANLKEGGPLKLGTAAMLALQQTGFFVGQEGRLVSNEGEFIVVTWDGMLYTLRFGEIAAQAGGDTVGKGEASKKTGMSEHRFVFVTADFDPKQAGVDVPANRQSDVVSKARKLQRRFADWFYVIAGEKFKALTTDRSTLTVKKPS